MLAFAGTPLRQAEAADGLASALAESASGAVVEPFDGGTGDGTDVSILTTRCGPPTLATTIVATPSLLNSVRLPASPPRYVGRRLALLQRLLF